MVKIFKKSNYTEENMAARLDAKESRIATLRAERDAHALSSAQLRGALENILRLNNNATIIGTRPDIRIRAMRNAAELIGLKCESGEETLRITGKMFSVEVKFVDTVESKILDWGDE